MLTFKRSQNLGARILNPRVNRIQTWLSESRNKLEGMRICSDRKADAQHTGCGYGLMPLQTSIVPRTVFFLTIFFKNNFCEPQ